MAPIDDDKRLLINFISTVKRILWVIVDKRQILFNKEASDIITYAWNDLNDDFQNVENKIRDFNEQQLLEERLSGNSLRFKLTLVKEILEMRDNFLLRDFKNSHIFGLEFRAEFFDYVLNEEEYSGVWSQVERMMAATTSERNTFIVKLKKLISRVLGNIEPLLDSILGLAGIGAPIKEFKESISKNFAWSSL